MIILVRKKVLILSACVLSAVSVAVAVSRHLPYVPAAAFEEVPNTVYVIDAGHGGEDGGAVAQDGTVESLINLEVSETLDALLCFLGHETHMTRAEDRALYSDGATTLREKKRSDLKNRVAFVSSIDGAVLLSIHQNSLPSVPAVRGAQAFYAGTSGSDALAKSVQQMLNQAINQERSKEAKEVPSSVYLMKNITCRAVLIECGFLSNAEETQLLKMPDHQRKLAIAITAGVLAHDTSEERGDP